MELEVKQAQNGSKEAFVRLIQNHELILYRLSKSFLKSDTDCADAIQETILKAYQSLHTLREPKYFKTWLIRILINECKNILKMRNKVISMNEIYDHPGVAGEYEQIEINEAFDSLEEDLRSVAVLYYVEDLSVKEISNVLELPEGTIKSRLYRARQKLAEWLGINKNRKESSK